MGQEGLNPGMTDSSLRKSLLNKQFPNNLHSAVASKASFKSHTLVAYRFEQKESKAGPLCHNGGLLSNPESLF
jgi:hypothetical protein